MDRKFYFITGFWGILILVLVARLSALQLFPNEYKKWAQINDLIKEYIPAERGKIYDRNGDLLVSNQPVYSVYVTPGHVKTFDTLLLARLLHLSKDEIKNKLIRAKRYSYVKPSLVTGQLLKKDIAPFKELAYLFPGFEIKKSLIRKYHTKHAAHILGYIQTVRPSDLKKDNYYEPGDVIGIAGIERYYEKLLRGKKGVRYFHRDKFNRKTIPYNKGKWDTLPRKGKDIYLSIDIKLQAFIDSLMQRKHGAVVVINPKNGEILSMVSAPGYDPDLLSGQKRSANFVKLLYDSVHKPLYNRALLGTYPPGSPFKIVNALIGLETGVIKPYTWYVCHHGFKYGNRFMRCHCGANGRVYLDYAIPYSCNTFFSRSYLDIINHTGNPRKGVQQWASMVKKFGLGNYLGYDLPIGKKGLIPDSLFYNRYFGNNKWRGTYIISNGIGQGQVLVTPIQLANMVSVVANRGFYYTLHFTSKIEDTILPEKFTRPKTTGFKQENFERIINGMLKVYTSGTARYSRIKNLQIAGKTGTSENYTLIDGKKVHLPDHSIFIAFAPADDPQIAVSVFIENGGYGATLAAPIASLIIDKYLNDTVSRPDLLKRVMETDLYPIYELKQKNEKGK